MTRTRTKFGSLLIITLLMMVSIPAIAQEDPSADDWISDIDYLITRLEIMHPNLYSMVTEENFKAAAESLQKRIPELTEIERFVGVMELVAMIQDGHTGAMVQEYFMGNPTAATNSYFYLVDFQQLSDGLFIAGIQDEHAEMLGKKVISFNGVPASQMISKMYNLISGDNDSGRRATIPIFLAFSPLLEYCGLENVNQSLSLRLQNSDGTEFDFKMTPPPLAEAFGSIMSYMQGAPNSGMKNVAELTDNPVPLYKMNPANSYWFKYLPEHKTMYVKLLSMEPKEEENFEQFYARMFKALDKNKAEKLVLDVRLNSGGDHYELPLLKGVIARSHIDKADKLFVIAGRKTFSAAQHFVNQFDLYTNATEVGENTGSKANFFGAVRRFNLPRTNVPIRSSIAYHQDDSTWNIEAGTRPRFYAPLSSSDLVSNRDPALELIFKFSEVKDLQEIFEDQLAAAYLNGDVDDLKSEYFRFQKEHHSTGINFEILALEFLNRMLEIKRDMTDYMLYGEFITEQFPESTEAWYYYGRRKMIAGDLEIAKECFHKSIEAHPMNIHAKRNLDLILLQEKTDAVPGK